MPYEKVGNNEPVCIADEVPFDIPDSWEWIRLGELCDIINGFTPLKTNPDFWSNGTIPWFTIDDVHSQGRRITFTNKHITTNALSKNSNRLLPSNTVLLCCTASVGEYAITEIPLTTNQQFNGLVIKEYYKEYYSPEFLFELVQTFKDRLINVAGKTTFNFVSVKKLGKLLIPILPLKEQERIIIKIRSVMPEVKKYNAKEIEINELNIQFPNLLKKSILQEAVQGKLVPQDPNDEPASVLLERIRAEKQALIKAGKIKKDKNESIIFRRDNSHYEKLNGIERCIDDEIPFDIPDNWCWVRLGTLFQHNTGKALNSSNKVGKKLRYITTSNLYWDKFVLDKLKEMPFTDAEVEKCTVIKGDLLVCEGGDIGRAAIWNYDFPMRIQNHIHRLRSYIKINVKFYYYIFYLYKHMGLIGGKGIGIKGLSSNAIHQLLFPLPPSNEQHKIVEKIEASLQFCKKL